MLKNQNRTSEAARLEDLWMGDFGDAYVERNRAAGDRRGPFWDTILSEFSVRSVLEVGCNIGANLRWCAARVDPKNVYGVDVNFKSLRDLRCSIPEINALWAIARELPFRDRWFDMVFTMGVLIHQPESTVTHVMSEIVRCSRRYVLCGEYFAEQTIEVRYRDQNDVLFKRDYGRLYLELFPEFRLCKQGFLSRDEGWDEVTYWVLEKP